MIRSKSEAEELAMMLEFAIMCDTFIESFWSKIFGLEKRLNFFHCHQINLDTQQVQR